MKGDGSGIRRRDQTAAWTDSQADGAGRLAQLYDEYGGRLYRLAYGILRSRADAEDAVQDVFVKIMGKLPDFVGEDREIQQWRWLARVMVNQCRDSLRKQKLRVYTPLEEMAEILESPQSSRSAEGERQMGQAVLAATLALPEKYRLPMILYYLEGFSVEEVSNILEIGRSAVKMRLARGREMVKKEMEGDMGHG